ncbi:Required for respiratory growth protein 9, mitochondrial [Cytospora mali]|uniref:Required for respiratory growth protein 9, mitochondrial n=1 Tax=Cytospora mali TaxID=578113 RepID=A0A194V1J4_CYTMA|nr:Required for respiratory growth protein 9, mitochondrial [Valsa mali var. pyri (nom. inval.)]
MACSCRTTALRIFVRSLTEVYAPNNNTLARTTWRSTRPSQLHIRTARLSVPCRQLHASSRAYSSSAQDGTADTVSSEATEQQQVAQEEGSPAQNVENPTAETHVAGNHEPSSPTTDDDILFEIKLRSKNARKKARKYGNATAPAPTTGEQVKQDAQDAPETQVVQGFQEVQEIQEVQEARGVREVQDGQEVQAAQAEQAVQERQPVKVTRIMVDETRGSKKSRRPNYLRRNIDDQPNEFTHEPPPKEEKKWDDNRWDGKKRDDRPMWAIQKDALKAKFPEGWMPRKKLSPDALAGIRALHQQFPEIYTTQALSAKFEVSPEAIRRILRSKWEPAPEEDEDRQRRWFNRGLKVWDRYAELGMTPPKKWQDAGIPDRYWNGRRWEEDEDQDGQDVDQEKIRRLKAQLKLARSLM